MLARSGSARAMFVEDLGNRSQIPMSPEFLSVPRVEPKPLESW